MQLIRHYFISADLDDLERFERQLEDGGVDTPQIHLLSRDDVAADRHRHIHKVKSLLRKDIVHSGLVGLAVGLIAAAAVVLLSAALGLNDSRAGWMPVVFLAIMFLGFCTWQGGFIGIQSANHEYARFEGALARGKHLFFVDLKPEQEELLEQVARQHPQAEDAGLGHPVPHWFIQTQRAIRAVFRVWP